MTMYVDWLFCFLWIVFNIFVEEHQSLGHRGQRGQCSGREGGMEGRKRVVVRREGGREGGRERERETLGLLTV